MQNKPCYSIIIPAFNEAATIKPLIEKVKKVAYPKKFEIIVVNDASTDGTADILKEIKQIKVLTNKVNRGKGFSIRKGIKHSRGRVVIIQDADLEYNPKDHLKMIAKLEEEKAEVVYGSRFLSGKSHLPRYRLFYWGNLLLSWLTRLLYKRQITDMETGYKMFKKKALARIKLTQERFGFEPEVTCKLIRAGVNIVEVPVSYKSRSYQQGKKIGLYDGMQAVYLLFKYLFSS